MHPPPPTHVQILILWEMFVLGVPLFIFAYSVRWNKVFSSDLFTLTIFLLLSLLNAKGFQLFFALSQRHSPRRSIHFRQCIQNLTLPFGDF